MNAFSAVFRWPYCTKSAYVKWSCNIEKIQHFFVVAVQSNKYNNHPSDFKLNTFMKFFLALMSDK